MFSKIVTSALFAGAATGLIAAALQFVFVQPVLLHAELFESGQLVHFDGQPTPAAADLPGFDPLRDGLSIVFNMLIYTGYALVLVALMAGLADRAGGLTARRGWLWGLAGFAAVQLAPAFSLAPELPGTAAAEVTARQVWWFATVAATAAGLGLAIFQRGWAATAGALVLILAPHIVGAPEPAAFTGPVPPEIAALFAARALGTGAIAWSALGILCAVFWLREGQRSAEAA